jgi:hypothetical protein
MPKPQIMSKKVISLFICLFTFLLTYNSFGQGTPVRTFKDTRVINAQSIETLKKGNLDFRVGHRFGDLAGDNGGWQTFYGLENSTDVSIGFDYGLTEYTMIGLHRMKGSNELRQLINLSIKQQLMREEVDGDKPFGLAVFGLVSVSTMPNSPNPDLLSHFDVFLHRVGYHFQIILSKKVSDRISLQLHPAWTHRNLTPIFEGGIMDQNGLVSLGYAGKIQLTKSTAIIVEGAFTFSDIRTTENGFYSPLGFGIEWETGGGHVFQLNLTNSTGMSETDYLPYTEENWLDGQFRLGFTVGRQFKIR